MNVAIIPARGGSKRIPKKNIKDFLGKPMIAYPIEVAIESGLFDKIIVSTDSEEIAKVAEKYGAEIPFIRPPELSDDFTGTNPVIRHAVEFLQALGNDLDLVCCIYATTPLLDKKYLQLGYEKIKDSNLDYVFSATTFPFPVQRAIKLNSDNLVRPAFAEYINSRSQDLEEMYHDAGQFYWGKLASWLSGKPAFYSKSHIVTLPRFRVQDIDTLEDWQQAEYKFMLLKR